MSFASRVVFPRRAVVLAVALAASSAYALGCSDSAGAGHAHAETDASATVVDGSATAGDASATVVDAGVAAAPVQVTAADFDCILAWQKVRGFRVKRLGGGPLAESLAVANSAGGGTYPPGTLLQLVPTEAMVKREPGFSAATKDWEFFALDAKKAGTTITARGGVEVVNAFGGNCFGCHNQAEAKWDLVCEQTHGCTALPISAATIQALQNADPRCP